MKKCPYCGHENEDNHCKHCYAVIPEEKTTDKSDFKNDTIEFKRIQKTKDKE